MNIGRASSFVEVADSRYEYRGGKSDAVLVLDSRSIPDGVQANVIVGLVEPYNTQALYPILFEHEVGDGQRLSCQQLSLVTSVEPWAYATVHWWKHGT